MVLNEKFKNKAVIQEILKIVLENNLHLIEKYSNYTSANMLVDDFENKESKTVEEILQKLSDKGIEIFAFGEIAKELKNIIDKISLEDNYNIDM